MTNRTACSIERAGGLLVFALATAACIEAEELSPATPQSEESSGEEGDPDADTDTDTDASTEATRHGYDVWQAALVEWEPTPERLPAVDRMTVRLQNPTDETRELKVSIRGFGFDARTVEQSLGTLLLEPGTDTAISIPLADLPLQSVNGPAEIVVIAEDLASGQRVVSDPRYVAFSPDLTEAFVFEVLRQLDSAAPPTMEAWLGSREALAGASTTPIGRLRLDTGSYVDAATLPEPAFADVPDPSAFDFDIPYFPAHKICARWRAEYQDPNEYQDFMQGAGPINVPASHAAIQFQTPPNYDFLSGQFTFPWTLWSGTLDSAGCTPWLYGFGAGNYYITLTTRLTRGDAVYDIKGNLETSNYNTTTSAYVTLGAPTQTVYANTLYTDSNVRAAAVLSQGLITADLGVDGRDLSFYSQDNCNGNGGCLYPGLGIIEVGSKGSVDLTKFRHILAHEYGHFIQDGMFGNFSSDYTQASPGGLCGCEHVNDKITNNKHCLQGREHISAAINEGFAHFAAAKIFNVRSDSNCAFSYYKEVYAYQTHLPPVTVMCKGPVRWMETYCLAADSGVEWDWMNFLWALNTEGADRLDIVDIERVFEQACGSSCSGKSVTFAQLQAAAQAVLPVGKRNNFNQKSIAYGVAH